MSAGGLRNGCFVSVTIGSFSGCYQYLTSIFHTPVGCGTHAFDYRVDVLRDGFRSAARVGRSRRAEGRFLEDTAVPWGHQVAVMFQIVSALALEVPAFLQNIGKLRGVSPDVQLSCEPWGHADHNGGGCECLSSDRTGAYVHSLSLIPRECLSRPELEDVSVSTEGSGDRRSHILSIGMGRPGSVSFVSH